MNKFLKGVKILGDIAFSVFMLVIGMAVILGMILDYGWYSILIIPALLILSAIMFIALTLIFSYCIYIVQNKKFTGYFGQIINNSKSARN